MILDYGVHNMKKKDQELIKGIVVGKEEFRVLASAKLEAKKSPQNGDRLSAAYAEARRKITGEEKE